MNDFQFLHVGFDFTPTKEMNENLKETFGHAKDWARYAPNCWVLWTSRSAGTWYKRIDATPGLPPTYGVLIAPIDLDSDERNGRLYEWMWKWIQKSR